MASWKALLKDLPGLSPVEKARAFHALYALRWSEEQISRYFQDALEVGDGFLALLLRQLSAPVTLPGDTLPKTGDALPKTVTIFAETADDDDIAVEKCIVTFMNESDFNRYLSANGGMLKRFKQGEEGASEGRCLTSYLELEDGGSYSSDMPLTRRVKSLKRYIANEARACKDELYIANEARACEDELALSMVSELKKNKLAENPVVRSDLRSHCRGMPTEQEFDVVIMEGRDRAFLGSVKHTDRGTNFISAFISEVQKVAERREDPVQFPSYAEFRGRMLGCCVRVDCLQEKASRDILHCCHRNGVGLFCRSGNALGMVVHPRSPGYMQTIGKGFLNLALTRGVFTISRLLH